MVHEAPCGIAAVTCGSSASFSYAFRDALQPRAVITAEEAYPVTVTKYIKSVLQFASCWPVRSPPGCYWRCVFAHPCLGMRISPRCWATKLCTARAVILGRRAEVRARLGHLLIDGFCVFDVSLSVSVTVRLAVLVPFPRTVTSTEKAYLLSMGCSMSVPLATSMIVGCPATASASHFCFMFSRCCGAEGCRRRGGLCLNTAHPSVIDWSQKFLVRVQLPAFTVDSICVTTGGKNTTAVFTDIADTNVTQAQLLQADLSLSLPPQSSKKITKSSALSCRPPGLPLRIWPSSHRRPRLEKAIPSTVRGAHGWTTTT